MTLLDVEAPAPPSRGDADPVETAAEGAPDNVSVPFTWAATTLATMAAALTLSGVFTGVAPRLLAVAAALVGPALVAASYRFGRPAILQYLAAPAAVALGAVAALAGSGTGSASLPTLVSDAVRGGGLGQPPVSFAPGWRFLLVTLVVLLGAGAASLGLGLARPRLGVAAPVPVVVAAALVQPGGSAVTTCTIALVLLVAALTVAAGATRSGASNTTSFELARLVRAAGALAALTVVLVALGSSGLLLPKAHSEQVVPPRPPKPSPVGKDRVLFTVRPDTATDTGPWITGVLDSYAHDTWLLPSFDRARLRRVQPGTAIPDAPAGPGPRRVHVEIGDLAGRNVPTVDDLQSVSAADLPLRYDPQTQALESVGQQAPPGTSYSIVAAAVPTAATLTRTPAPPTSMAGYLTAPPVPSQVARVLAATSGQPRFVRLQQARAYLYSHAVAAGQGQPQPVPPQRVADMFAGAHATPFEITAAEALLARWVGVPSRIGFGYDGGVASADHRTLAVHPSDGATWLQTWWSGVGWVSIVGRPAQAVTPTSLDPHHQLAGLRGNGQLALVVHVPVRLASLRGLYDDVRFYTLVALPWLVLAALVAVFHPVAWKALRRRRRARWARRSLAARLLVGYADFRDRMLDLNAPGPNATPLEFCSSIDADDEHWELAWLVSRALWGDLARDLRLEDVVAGEEMVRSVRRRVLRAQRLPTRISAAASRASLRDPWTTDIPNFWPRRPRLALPRLPMRAIRPAPATAAVLVVAAVLLSGCSASRPGAPATLPAPFVPSAVGSYALRESTDAERAFSQAGRAALVNDGKVWTVVAPDGTVKGSLQAGAFKPSLRSHLDAVERGVRRSIGSGAFTHRRLGAREIYVLDQSQEQLLLYFPPAGSYYELLDVRNDFGDAQRLFAGVLDFQQGARSRPLPPELDPRRGGD